MINHGTRRTGRVDFKDLGGKRIPKGESVLCPLGSANRDLAVYPDRPDRLCLGAQLARIEAEIAIATLLPRLPELKLDNAESPQWRPTFVLRGLTKLPASW